MGNGCVSQPPQPIGADGMTDAERTQLHAFLANRRALIILDNDTLLRGACPDPRRADANPYDSPNTLWGHACELLRRVLAVTDAARCPTRLVALCSRAIPEIPDATAASVHLWEARADALTGDTGPSDRVARALCDAKDAACHNGTPMLIVVLTQTEVRELRAAIQYTPPGLNAWCVLFDVGHTHIAPDLRTTRAQEYVRTTGVSFVARYRCEYEAACEYGTHRAYTKSRHVALGLIGAQPSRGFHEAGGCV